MGEWRTQVTIINRRLHDQAENIQTNSTRINALEQRLTELEERLDEIRPNQDFNQDEIHNLRAALRANRENIDDL